MKPASQVHKVIHKFEQTCVKQTYNNAANYNNAHYNNSIVKYSFLCRP